MLLIITYTPLKIYNGTALAVPLEIQGQPLPINELNGTPPKEACPISNLHRFKPLFYLMVPRFKCRFASNVASLQRSLRFKCRFASKVASLQMSLRFKCRFASPKTLLQYCIIQIPLFHLFKRSHIFI
jgi:hypothetical protein